MSVLKLAGPLLLIACLLQKLPVYSQPDRLITLTEKNVPLEKVLEDIHQKTGYTYFGESNWTQLSHRVSFSVRKATLKQVLDSCFRDQPFIYEIIDSAIAIHPRPRKEMIVHGWIFTEKKEPMAGVTVLVRGEPGVAAVSKENGEFNIHTRFVDNLLLFSSVNYEPQELQPEEGKDVVVLLREKIGELRDVVVVHNGYEDKNRKGSTGASDVVGTELFDRRVSFNILDHIDGITNSVLFNKNIVAGTNQSAITIRGRSTIFANPNPLIVVDNFPYTGDISNINPEDIESVTVLKDAAAASIWGAFSGNGVLVITTKKGRLNQAPKLSFTTSQTIGEKPDLYYQPILSSADYIDIEQFGYRKGAYIGALSPFVHGAVTPAVEIFDQTRKGLISPADSASKINALKGQDVRRDLDRYFYRRSLNSQYALNISGGGPRNQYFLSAGYDQNKSNLDRNLYSRVTLFGNNTYLLLPGKLELSTGLAFSSGKAYLNNTGLINVNYPYARLADVNGDGLPVNFGYKNSYIDTAGGGQLPDWHYVPLDEIKNADHTLRLIDYRINIRLRYIIRKGLEVNGYYQYGRGDSSSNIYQGLQTYFTRRLIDLYAQTGNGQVFFPIPKGGILDEQRSTYIANNARLQVNYSDTLFRRGLLNVAGGAEVRDIAGEQRQNRLYGYEKGASVSTGVDYMTQWFLAAANAKARIPYIDQDIARAERYLSYYLSADYTYLGRYILSASSRRDESNLFGVRTNQRGVPLWSVGGAWLLSKEDFYRVKWLPFFKLRVTDGYNGNVDRSTSAYTTAYFNQDGNSYGASSITIVNPANPSLRWERINTFDAGLDFSTPGDRLGGSFDYYIKNGKDLIGLSPLDPTVGITPFRANTANMIDHGVDISLHANLKLGPVRWSSVILFSYVRDRVTQYKQKIGPVQTYLTPTFINPFVGRPLYSVYALAWGGLDPLTGDPRGLLAKQITKDYSSIVNSTDLDNMVYMGPASPPVFGSWRNSLYWRQFGLSWNILYKMGYVFRRNSIFYSQIFGGTSAGHPDYERRWQNPGDEKTTDVPSLVYTTDKLRDNFYQNSTVLVEKGDHIRLQDVLLSYDIDRAVYKRLPVARIRLYLYANNLGILWKANHAGVDPDNVSGIPNPKTLAIGAKMDF
jgi:TonB-linked SusC/RagA family outer membrane protein